MTYLISYLVIGLVVGAVLAFFARKGEFDDILVAMISVLIWPFWVVGILFALISVLGQRWRKRCT